MDAIFESNMIAETLLMIYRERFFGLDIDALQKMKYEVHTKLPQIAYQIWIWYDICGNLV